jgi:hypothetical protein
MINHLNDKMIESRVTLIFEVAFDELFGETKNNR